MLRLNLRHLRNFQIVPHLASDLLAMREKTCFKAGLCGIDVGRMSFEKGKKNYVIERNRDEGEIAVSDETEHQ